MIRQIYANAVCDIAASASDSPEGGLFQTRNIQDIRPGIISTILSSELPQRFYIFDKSYGIASCWLDHFTAGAGSFRSGSSGRGSSTLPRIKYYGNVSRYTSVRAFLKGFPARIFQKYQGLAGLARYQDNAGRATEAR